MMLVYRVSQHLHTGSVSSNSSVFGESLNHIGQYLRSHTKHTVPSHQVNSQQLLQSSCSLCIL